MIELLLFFVLMFVSFVLHDILDYLWISIVNLVPYFLYELLCFAFHSRIVAAYGVQDSVEETLFGFARRTTVHMMFVFFLFSTFCSFVQLISSNIYRYVYVSQHL